MIGLSLRAGAPALAALLLGLVLPFAFAPYALWWLAPPGLMALFVLWHGTSPRTAAWRGYLFGLGFLGHGVGWVQISIHQFGLPLYVFSVSMTALFVMFISLYPALAGFLSRRLPVRNETWRLCALAPALWAMSEWARGCWFSGFPWLLFGDSQLGSPLAGWLPVVGAQGTGLLLALTAGAVSALIARRALQPLLLVLAVTPWVAGAVLNRIEWTTPAGPAQSVALVQGAVPQAVKWSPEARAATLERYASLTEPHWGARIIVWPETALPAFPAEIPEFLANLNARAKASGTAFLLGLPTAESAERYFNSLVLLGAAEARYDKHHLVPFGEYLPFDEVLRPALDFLSIPMSGFSAGAALQPPLRAGELSLGATICYEDAYASEVRKALPAANLLVNVSNDAWFGDSAAPHQHLQITRIRAAETGREFLRATNTGISAIIDHRGALRGHSPQFEPFVLEGRVTPRMGATPYVRMGEWPLGIGLLLMLTGAVGRGSTKSSLSV